MTSIIFQNVTKAFSRGNGDCRSVISNLSLLISNNSFITVVGPNGCGKTTLLNLVAGIVLPDSGTITVETEHGNGPRIGYVWQDYRSSLLPWLDVGENIAFPLRTHGMGRVERRRAAKGALAGFSSEIPINQPVYQLSGGQQQLVSLLRSSVAAPDVLLFDEPFSALDQSNRWSMAFRTEHFWMARKIPALFVSHDVDEAVMLADRVLLMSRDGGAIARTIENSLPRPRGVKMLTSPEHIRCREEVIEFLFAEGAIRD